VNDSKLLMVDDVLNRRRSGFRIGKATKVRAQNRGEDSGITLLVDSLAVDSLTFNGLASAERGVHLSIDQVEHAVLDRVGLAQKLGPLVGSKDLELHVGNQAWNANSEHGRDGLGLARARVASSSNGLGLRRATLRRTAGGRVLNANAVVVRREDIVVILGT